MALNTSLERQIYPEPQNIVHTHVGDGNGKLAIFHHDSGILGGFSGQIEPGETCEMAVTREALEELNIRLDRIIVTEDTHYGTSHRGKPVFITTCLGFLPKGFIPSMLQFNHEIVGYELLSQIEALRKLRQAGYQETYRGLLFIVKNKLI